MSHDALGRFGALAIGAMALLGCATPIAYGPIGENGGFGYSEARNADGSYTVRVVSVSAQQAHEFWDRRAAELCGGSNFRKNIFRAEIPVVRYTGYAPGPNGYGGSYTEDRYGSLILEGYLHCDGDAQATVAEQTPAAPSAITAPDAGSQPQP
ncbi:MAG: hypothetical protein ACT4OF_09090 [Caulobacteraceae bacterium]